MTSPRTIATRLALAGGVAVLATTIGAVPAGAESADLTFACEFDVSGTSGEGSALASFDTSVGDGVVVEVGDEVDLNPHTASIRLPDAFVAALRADGVTSIDGGGVELVIVDETGDEVEVLFEFPDTPVPATGPMTLQVTGESDAITAEEEGTYTLVVEAFLLGYGEDEETGGLLFCELDDEGDPTVDAFEVVAATSTPTPTVTVTATPTASPVRPAVVQTDFAGDSPSALPVVLAGGVVVLGAGIVAGGRRRAGARRH